MYDRYPCMPDTSWAARACTCGAIDPSLGQAMSFPSLLQLKLRIEVPLWRNVAEAKHPPTDPQSDGSDTDSPASGSKERSPRYAQPVPVGGAELPEAETEGEAEEEDTVAEPTYAFAQGFGRFVIRYTRLATALGNFEQGSIQTESTAVAHWLMSGLKVALSPIWTDKAPGGATQTLLLPRLPPITRRRSPIPPIWSDSIHRGPVGRASQMAVW